MIPGIAPVVLLLMLFLWLGLTRRGLGRGTHLTLLIGIVTLLALNYTGFL